MKLEVPSYPALEARRKVSAAWLVEHSGFAKGYTRGAVGISRKHALAIVNRGGATAADLNVARQMLKDNGISAIPTESNPLGKLKDALPFQSTEEIAADQERL